MHCKPNTEIMRYRSLSPELSQLSMSRCNRMDGKHSESDVRSGGDCTHKQIRRHSYESLRRGIPLNGGLPSTCWPPWRYAKVKQIENSTPLKSPFICQKNFHEKVFLSFNTLLVLFLCLLIVSPLYYVLFSRILINSSKLQYHQKGTFFQKVSDNPRCRVKYSTLGEIGEILLAQSGATVWPHTNDTYCERLWSILDSCFIEDSAMPPPQPLPNYFLSGYHNINGLHPNNKANQHFRQPPISSEINDSYLLNRVHLYRRASILLVQPIIYNSEPFLENFLTHFLKSWQIKFKHTVFHTPALFCNAFVTAIDMQASSSSPVVIYGRRTFGIHRYLSRYKPNLYITWLSNPIQRVVATYVTLKSQPEPPYAHDYFVSLVKNSSDIQSFLQQTNHVQIPYFDNFLVRLLQFGSDPSFDAFFSGTRDAILPSSIYNVPQVTKEHYERARENLYSAFAFVGIQSKADESAQLLCELFSLDKGCFGETSRLYRLNPASPSLGRYEFAEISRRNKWDLKLYKEALLIMESQLAAVNGSVATNY